MSVQDQTPSQIGNDVLEAMETLIVLSKQLGHDDVRKTVHSYVWPHMLRDGNMSVAMMFAAAFAMGHTEQLANILAARGKDPE